VHEVVLFDRYRLFVDALDAALRTAGVAVAGKATNETELLALIDSTAADLLLVGLGAEDGPEALEIIRRVGRRSPSLKAIVVSRDGEGDPTEAFEAGATAFVARGATVDDIAFAIKQSFEHSIHFAPNRGAGERTTGTQGEFGLSPRELEILQLVAEGRASSDVARELWISEQTVKFHLSNIFRKLGVTNRTQASRRAQQLKLVSLRASSSAEEASAS
jgi:DNA-binding NarL/FixJ family response regulator